jgi:carboxypeptidase Taq
MGEKLQALKERLATISDLYASQAVLSWDQETYMPSGSVNARAKQLSTLGKLSHEMFTSDETGSLLDAAAAELNGESYDSEDASIVRVIKRDFEEATKLPSSLVAQISETSSAAKEAWKEAYYSSDFETFRPHLDKSLELAIKKAEALGYEDHIYDALLDQYEPGMKTAEVAQIFDDLKPELISLVKQIASAEQVDDSFLHLDYDEETQLNFGEFVIRKFGFDFDKGRQDLAHHPFATSFSVNDVRLTTRVSKNFLPTALFGTLHECGHGLYEQGVSENLERTMLSGGTSLGIHESQSRTWENIIGRSLGFWKHFYGELQSTFPDQLGGVSLESFYKGINKVEPSLIRVEADEVTYNLHIMLRFEIETAMVSGKIDTKDLPEIWNSKFEEFLGVKPSNNTEGVLQDIHWSMGGIGYFSTYALGNLFSTQFFDKAKQDIPNLDQKIESGEYLELREWQRDNIHTHGRKFTANELLERVTGQPLQASSYLAYIKSKFSGIYGELS